MMDWKIVLLALLSAPTAPGAPPAPTKAPTSGVWVRCACSPNAPRFQLYRGPAQLDFCLRGLYCDCARGLHDACGSPRRLREGAEAEEDDDGLPSAEWFDEGMQQCSPTFDCHAFFDKRGPRAATVPPVPSFSIVSAMTPASLVNDTSVETTLETSPEDTTPTDSTTDGTPGTAEPSPPTSSTPSTATSATTEAPATPTATPRPTTSTYPASITGKPNTPPGANTDPTTATTDPTATDPTATDPTATTPQGKGGSASTPPVALPLLVLVAGLML
ncbi:leucine-rich repeat extensin-like protein 5 [Thrips palmi]|uniref:Leucine-rich repeat extensin-like protein 5 n=1 Tax=Thrips palmi TaxID=161013 RepID=A0A6P8YNF5_THRPL|nr:leucine-rich repeat extensin-like protein 5 [Thrips palmi]